MIASQLYQLYFDLGTIQNKIELNRTLIYL